MAGTWKSRSARFHKAATEVRKPKTAFMTIGFLIPKVSSIAQEVSWPWSRPDWAADSPTRVKGQIIATSNDLKGSEEEGKSLTILRNLGFGHRCF